MQVVHVVIAADRVHIGVDAGAGFIAVVPERMALPLGEALDDLCLPFHVFHGEMDFSFDTVQVVVETAGLCHHQRCGDTVEVQRLAEFELECIFHGLDRILRLPLTEFALISFRIDRIDHSRLPLIVDQVLIDLPLRDLGPVVVPFRFLSGDVVIEHMVAEGLANERILLRFGNGFFQGAGQAVDAVGSQFLIAQDEDVLVIGGLRNEASLDAVKSGREAKRHFEVRVAGRVRAAELDTGALAPARRDPDEAGTVGSTPHEVARSLIAGYEAFVGVDGRVGERRNTFDVFHDAGDERIGFFGEAEFSVRVVEDVLPGREFIKAHIGVHAGAVDPVDGFRHKGRVKAVLGSIGLDDMLEGHDTVRGHEALAELEVDLMLAFGHFMVRGFDDVTHLLECEANVSSAVFTVIDRIQVEVTGFVGHFGGRLSFLIQFEEEELTLGTVTIVPKNIKKWISVSDEVMDLRGQAFLDYVYDELAYKIVKKAEHIVVAKIIAGIGASTSTKAGQAAVYADIGRAGVVDAISNISDEAEDLCIIMNRRTWGQYEATRTLNTLDPFADLPVVYDSSLKAYDTAEDGDVYAIVGDPGFGFRANLPNGFNVKTVVNEDGPADKVKITGKLFAGLEAIAVNAFCGIKKGDAPES